MSGPVYSFDANSLFPPPGYSLNINGDMSLMSREAQISIILGRTINALGELSQSRFSVESLLDNLVRILTKLYATLGSLTKYFFNRVRSSTVDGADAIRAAKFDKLVDLVGCQLTKPAYALITFIEVRDLKSL